MIILEYFNRCRSSCKALNSLEDKRVVASTEPLVNRLDDLCRVCVDDKDFH